MDYVAAKYIGAGLACLGMLGAAIGVGIVFAGMLQAIARNPGAEQQMKQYAYVGAGLAEAMGLFAFIVAAVLIFVIK